MTERTAVVTASLVLVAVLGAVAPAAGVGGSDRASAETGGVDGCSYPFTATDSTGVEVTVTEEPDRIVTLQPSAAQTLWELNASGKVVGVSDNALYLDGADGKTVVARGQTVEMETIVGLEPDVVLAPNVVPNETVATLRSNGLTVYRFRPAKNFTDIYRKTELIGRLSGECDAAAATVTDMRRRVTAIREAVSDEDRPGALYTFFGYTAGTNTFIDAILTTAGTRNVASEVGIDRYGQLSDEVVANNSAEIEWLVLNSDPASHPSNDVYNGTTAVKRDQVVVLNINYLNQPAPRTVLALENLTRAVHPEAYREAQATLATPTETDAGPTPTPTAASPTPERRTDTPGPVDDTPAPTTDGSGPGFTVATFVLAVLGVAFLARRR